MATRTPTNPNLNRLANVLTVVGLLFVIAGGLIAYPIIRDAVLPPPTSFGEAQPALELLPTVTPLPHDNGATPDATASVPPPDVLPETPLLAPGQAVPTAVQDDNSSASQTGAQIPTRIVIPAIQLDAPIETVGWSQVQGGSVWNIPNHFAAGWLKTSKPLGQPGNTVLDGHHNMAGEVFRNLVNLKRGDLIEVYSDNQVFYYQVTTRQILLDRDQPIEVRRRNAMWIGPTLDERLTLVTCWPYTNNTHRLIIVAKPMNPNSDSFNP